MNKCHKGAFAGHFFNFGVSFSDNIGWLMSYLWLVFMQVITVFEKAFFSRSALLFVILTNPMHYNRFNNTFKVTHLSAGWFVSFRYASFSHKPTNAQRVTIMWR